MMVGTTSLGSASSPNVFQYLAAREKLNQEPLKRVMTSLQMESKSYLSTCFHRPQYSFSAVAYERVGFHTTVGAMSGSHTVPPRLQGRGL